MSAAPTAAARCAPRLDRPGRDTRSQARAAASGTSSAATDRAERDVARAPDDQNEDDERERHDERREREEDADARRHALAAAKPQPDGEAMPDDGRDGARGDQPVDAEVRPGEPAREQDGERALQRVERERQTPAHFPARRVTFVAPVPPDPVSRTSPAASRAHDQIAERDRAEQVRREDQEGGNIASDQTPAQEVERGLRSAPADEGAVAGEEQLAVLSVRVVREGDVDEADGLLPLRRPGRRCP